MEEKLVKPPIRRGLNFQIDESYDDPNQEEDINWVDE